MLSKKREEILFYAFYIYFDVDNSDYILKRLLSYADDRNNKIPLAYCMFSKNMYIIQKIYISRNLT